MKDPDDEGQASTAPETLDLGSEGNEASSTPSPVLPLVEGVADGAPSLREQVVRPVATGTQGGAHLAESSEVEVSQETLCTLPETVESGTSGRAAQRLNGWLRERRFLKVPAGNVYDLNTLQAVQRAQRQARADGTYDGPVNGQWDERTRTALCTTRWP